MDTLVLPALVGLVYAVLAWIGVRYLLGLRRRPPFAAADRSRPSRERTQVPRRIDLRASLRVHRAIIAGVVFGLPLAIALAYAVARHTIGLDDAATAKSDEHVDWTLRGAKLVPPAPLPPDVFVTADRPFLDGADRDWAKLDPLFRDRVLGALQAAAQRGYPLTLLEGYRSPARQDFLAEQGAHVTLARAFQSKHQFGLAADLAPLRDGALVIRETDPWAMAAYRVLGEEAERRGLAWGGRWAMQDYGHVETR